ncbi:MAG: uracil-DNA glycosylase [Treponema sp.]|nr:uracil-DNA glycosylase [Treponema sp.]
MTQEERQKIYTLLKTAAQNAYGYTPISFKNDVCPEVQKPVFEQNTQVQFTPENTPIVNDSVTPEPDSVNTNEVFAYNIQLSESAKRAPDLIVPKTTLSLEDLNKKISRCTRCQLARTRTNTVSGVGVPHPELMVIGEAPGQEEDIQGLPFVGKAGQLLDKMLNAIKLDRHSNCFIANIVKCRPPENRDPLSSEAEACIGFLEAQINILKPKMILCAGRVAAHNLLKNELSMNSLRGNFYEYNKIPVYVTYHPSAVLRDETLKAPVWNDLKTVGSRLKEISPSYASLFSNK